MTVTTTAVSDALVFFGATGDLAHKMIFPALQALVKDGRLDAPIIGVAKAGWNREQLLARARDSLENFGGGVDRAAFEKLSGLLRYIDGDYEDPRTFDQLHVALGNAQRPLHYLAIPPSAFGTVSKELDRKARHVVRASWWRNRETLRPRPRIGACTELHPARCAPRILDLPHRSLPRQRSRPKPALLSLWQFVVVLPASVCD